MRHSEFWTLMDEEFGRAYARSLASRLVIAAVGDRTVEDALGQGVPPREVWAAVCDVMDVPDERRWGRDPRRGGRRARHP